MNAAPQAADRIMEALCDLLSREAVAARAASGLRVRSVQARIKPLMEALSRMAAFSASPGFNQAMARLSERRSDNLRLMREALARIRSERDARSAALARIQRVGPVYSGRIPVASRLDACT
jgi:hypothetical protein